LICGNLTTKNASEHSTCDASARNASDNASDNASANVSLLDDVSNLFGDFSRSDHGSGINLNLLDHNSLSLNGYGWRWRRWRWRRRRDKYRHQPARLQLIREDQRKQNHHPKYAGLQKKGRK